MTQTVLITGCSSGFGYEMALSFLKEGWTVIATLRDAEARRIVFQELTEGFRDRLHVVSLDVTNAEDRRRVAGWIESEHSASLHCLINNAGYGHFGALEDISEAQLRAQFEVNFFGLALLTRELLPYLRRAQGRIVNISSVLGTIGLPLTSSYCASKFAVEGLTESLYYELAPHGVQVSLIEPGGFRTQFMENSRWGEPSVDHSSAYALQTKNYQKLRDDFMARQKVYRGGIGAIALRLMRTSRMPLRVTVGTDAKLTAWGLRLLPRAWFHGILRFAIGKLLSRRR